MELLNFTSNIPEENIALDELMLAKAENEETGETLRFWMSEEYFIVLGRAGRVNDDCFLYKCNSENIKIIRRISGGGTVLQGPGCLNYSAVVSYDRNKKYRDINYSYNDLLGNIAEELKKKQGNVAFSPISDITCGNKKISGNAQARKKKFFLLHGTILFDFDLGKIPEYLKHPQDEPPYREGREHADFVTNLSVDPEEIKGVIKKVFEVSEDVVKFGGEDLRKLNDLVIEKYLDQSWNYSF